MEPYYLGSNKSSLEGNTLLSWVITFESLMFNFGGIWSNLTTDLLKSITFLGIKSLWPNSQETNMQRVSDISEKLYIYKPF